MALTDKQRRFVDEYLVDLNATQAAIRAGYSTKTAEQQASRLLSFVKVQKAIQERMQEREARTEITQDMVLRRFWEIANVDVNELIEYRRNNCRHCWGIDHAYQWIESEYLRESQRAIANSAEVPDCSGGFGFQPNREPNAECPHCSGEGVGKVHVHDTRNLKGAARRAYNGVQVGKDGLKVLVLDRDKALENVARHLGMYRVEHSGPGGGPIPVRTEVAIMLENLSDEQLSHLEAIAIAAIARPGGDQG